MNIHTAICMRMSGKAITGKMIYNVDDSINERLIQLVCFHSGLSIEEFYGKGRQRERVIARCVYFHLARIKTDKNLTQLARQFGKDHTTIIHSLRKAKDAIDTKYFPFLSLKEKVENSL